MAFSYGTKLTGFILDATRPDTVIGITAKVGNEAVKIEADKVVLCCGPQTQPICMKHFNLNLRITGMRGCSLDLYDVEGGPPITVSDYISGGLSHQLMPFKNNRLRIVGFSDFVSVENIDTLEGASTEAEALRKFPCHPLYPQVLLKRMQKVSVYSSFCICAFVRPRVISTSRIPFDVLIRSSLI